ncbi:MAG TPA: ArsR family transcriptional regulator [Candidatus Thermoplasmatota archaeon]|nr:ArsR family transcriptional regulator [Candidatus Thermoplasmatota archaeon]
MRRLYALLAIVLLLSVSAVSALSFAVSPFREDPVTLTTGETRVGDRFRFDAVWRLGEEERNGTLLVTVEGPSRASDRFGIDRGTDAYLLDFLGPEGRTLARCHALRGGPDTVRTESEEAPVFHFRDGFNFSLFGVPLLGYNMEWAFAFDTSFSDIPCPLRSGLRAATWTEGATPTSAELLRDGYNHTWQTGGAPSLPAVATTFHGRPALRFEYPYAAGGPEDRIVGNLTIVLADGLPGPVLTEVTGQHYEMELWYEDQQVKQRELPPVPFHSREELTGWLPGDGPLLEANVGNRLPARNPALETTRFERDRMDLQAFRFDYSLAEALEALEGDPSVGYAQFMAENPNAFLVNARYDTGQSDMGNVVLDRGEVDGRWVIFVQSGTRFYFAESARYTGVESPAGSLGFPVRHVINRDYGPLVAGPDTILGELEPREEEPVTYPERTVASSTFAPILEKELGDSSLLVSRADLIRGEAPDGRFTAIARLQIVTSDSLEKNGLPRSAWVDWEAGGLMSLERGDFQMRSALAPGLVDGKGGESWTAPLEASTSSFALPPGTGLQVTVAATAALAALLIALKVFALPFYTRLRRDRLLDNPVRARLYECVRANAGITRGELVDYMGLGPSPTHHHLDKLVEAQFLVTADTDRHVRYFVAGDLPPDLARREAVLRAGSNRRVYELLQAEPHLSLREAAARLGMSAPSVHRSVKKLREAGLLAPEKGLVTATAEA